MLFNGFFCDNNGDILQSEEDSDGEEVENDDNEEEDDDDGEEDVDNNDGEKDNDNNDGEEGDDNDNVLQNENGNGEASTVAQMDIDDEYESRINNVSENEHNTSESEDNYFSDDNILWEEEMYSDDDNFDDVNLMGGNIYNMYQNYLFILKLFILMFTFKFYRIK